jgi:ketosteroid isomerase-like protein
MTPETTLTGLPGRQRAAAVWSAFATRDPDQISAVLTPEAEWLAPPGNATALAIGDGTSHMIGRDRIVRFLTQELDTVFVADRTFDVAAMFADGDVVITEARITCTLPHGGHYENDYCFTFEFSGGLLHRIREYMDSRLGRRGDRAGDCGLAELCADCLLRPADGGRCATPRCKLARAWQ